MQDALLWGLFFLVGMVYASVGHGGASGYLAVLSLVQAVKPGTASATALCLNLIVATIAWVTYFRAGYFRWRMAVPLVLASVPMAFVGGMMPVGEKTYSLLLALALLAAGLRLMLSNGNKTEIPSEEKTKISWSLALLAGAGIGWLSGVVGVGGGIFLSPLMLLCRWADIWTTAAVSAFFILANSASGLLGRAFSAQCEGLRMGSLLPLAIASGIGGILGARLGAHKFSGLWLRRTLALVLFMACIKLALKALADHLA